MRYLVACATALVVTFSTSLAADSLAEKTWTVDGETRKAMVYTPPASKVAAPLIFVFHGHGGNMKLSARLHTLNKHWPEAVIVYPQGLPTPVKLVDPEGNKSGWQIAPGEQKDRDLKFFDAMLATLKKENNIDAKRIYSTGHSNGGAFTYLLWSQRGDVFAAFAPSAGIITRGFKDLKPKPVMHIAGENDTLVKYEWQKKMIDLDRKVNGTEGEGKSWAKVGDLVGTKYESKTGTPVVTLISPGSHNYPENADELIVRFFKEHSKK